MTIASAHDFFTTAAEVAGGLIGLLFVAISVSPERILSPDASEIHSVRAAAALTAFTNALAVGLFGLVPGFNVGSTATAVAVLGLLFVVGVLLRVVPAWREQRVRLGDLIFLVGLLVVFILQLSAGLALDARASDSNALESICVLVIVCFLIGIARAWELIGGPQMMPSHVVIERVRARRGAQGRDEG